MRTVYIEFTSSTKAFPIYSWLIQLVERTPYSHVRISFQTRWFNTYILEAAGSAVRLIGEFGKTYYPVKIHHRYKMEITDEQFTELLKLFKYAGVKYGTLQAIGIGIQRLFRLKRNPFADGDYSFICSELVAYFLFGVLRMKIADEDLPDFELAGPRAIKEWLDAHSEIAVKIS